MSRPTNPKIRKARPELLGLIEPAEAARAAYACLNQLQSYDAEAQVAGAALVFLAACRRLKVHPGTVLDVASNVVSRTEKHVVELRALRAYMEEELVE
jgi:hypothetical protein